MKSTRNTLVAQPPSINNNTTKPSFQRRRYSSPEKTSTDPAEAMWLPLALPNNILVNVTTSKNMIQIDTLGKKSTDLVFLEEYDNYLSLKVFDGLKFVFSDIIMGHSCGLLTYIQLAESFDQSQTPAFVIAARDELYIYHRNSTLFNVKLDPVSISDIETDYWNQLWKYSSNQDKGEFERVIDQIRESRKSGNVSLSYQMQKMLSIPSTDAMQDFIKTNEISTNIQIHISAIDILPKRETTDGFSPSVIVLGTLECEIYLLTPTKYLISDRFQLSSAVMQMKCVGSYFGDFKIFVLGMDGCVYVISRNKCSEIIQCENNPNHFILSKYFIFLSFMDKNVKSFNHSGQVMFTLNFSFPILHMEPFIIEHKKVYGFMVALQNKEIKIYNGSDVIFDLNLENNVSAFCFGQFKGEDMALVSVLENQRLNVNVLKRNSSFTLEDRANKKVEFGFSKKSQAYVDCLKRERNDAKGTGIYDRFQKMELISHVCLNRKQICAYSSMPITIDLNIEVIGICSPFSLLFKTTNKSSNPAAHLILNIQTLSNVKLSPNIVKIPFLPPDASCLTDGILDCMDENKLIELTCRILCKGRTKPVLSTIVSLSLTASSSYTESEDKAAAYAQRIS